MWAKVVEYQSSGVQCVELIDTAQAGGDRNIGHELFKQGLASWVEEEKGSNTGITQTRDN